MADIDYCEACETLKEVDANLVVNGFTDENCANLQENTGLAGDSDDCTDLNTMNDCLIGSQVDEAEISDVCSWREYMGGFVQNVWTMFKAMICSVCGLWERLITLEAELDASSYIGILTLYTDERTEGDGSSAQSPAFDMNVRQGNVTEDVLTVNNDYKGIIVENTTSVPLLVEATFNCSIETDQNFCCAYILVLRDDIAVGQTPFIVPSSYDQQVMAEPFILNPGESTELTYVFRVGAKNNWFRSQFGGGTYVKCILDEVVSTQQNQRSYFNVRVSSVMNIDIS